MPELATSSEREFGNLGSHLHIFTFLHDVNRLFLGTSFFTWIGRIRFSLRRSSSSDAAIS